jgi:hypothetical protein
MVMAFDPHTSGGLRLLIHFALTLWFATDTVAVWRGICGQLGVASRKLLPKITLHIFEQDFE